MSCAPILLRLTCLLAGIAICVAQSQPPAPDQFQTCATCHGGDAQGGEHGPPIAARLLTLDDDELMQIIRGGKPQIGMPAFPLNDADMQRLIRYLRTLERPERQSVIRASVETIHGELFEGLVLSQSVGEMQLLSDDHRLHLLRREGERYREVTSDVDWSGYNGDPSGNRYSRLSQVDTANVSRLAPRWIFQLPGGANLQTTPAVVAGVMYVTSANECWALDAGSGRPIWHYQRRRTRGIGGTAAGGVNRGVAVAGNRVFMVTDNAHLIALDRSAGTLLWDTEMADWRQNYYATGAPLIAGSLVLAGVAGGDDGVRGFVAAFDAGSGKEVWRFWTVPKPGEPRSETWNGRDVNHPGGATWLTGTYDPDSGIVYWP
ncbi:MAG TPA: PQQ-binding-like beta-propeller repeat protein, partial [Bryobacteraceae bacterium]|nr:PQQ-binding-like beta-propeller repeat protein [Bryobacteraceae bacterium]